MDAHDDNVVDLPVFEQIVDLLPIVADSVLGRNVDGVDLAGPTFAARSSFLAFTAARFWCVAGALLGV